MTIFLGLPLGRMQGGPFRLKTLLGGLSAGVLVFLLVEIFEHSFGPVEAALVRFQDGGGSFWRFLSLVGVFAVGLAIGLMGLVYVGRLWRRRRTSATGASLGPGAMAVTEASALRPQSLRLGMAIATGIGLH